MMTTLQNAIRSLEYSRKHTAQFDGKTYEFFKLESTGYIYVLCVNSNRATRYNCEGMNGKRIGMNEYLEADDQLENEANIKALDDAAEDENVSVEEFAQKVEEINYCRHPHGGDLSKPAELNEFGCVDCSKCNVQECVHRDCMRRNPTNVGGLGECPRLKVVAEIEDETENWNDVQDSHNAWTAVDEITYDVVAHAIRTIGKNDEEIEEIMGMIGKDAKMVMDFNEATSTLNADEFNAYIKSQLDVLLNGEATGSLTEATEAHSEAETAENTPDNSNATESLGEATENVPAEKKAEKTTKKARKSKDTFHTSTAVPGLTLTAKQTSFMLHLSDTCFWEEGLDSVIWVDCLCDDIQGEFAGKPMTVGAMISTLCEKKLGVRATERRDGKKCTSFALTELGKKIAEEVGLH